MNPLQISYTNAETGRCNACGRIFTRQGNLTKHQRDHCTAARRHSKEHWKHASVNLKKLDHTHTVHKRPTVGPRLHDMTNVSQVERGSVDVPSPLETVSSVFLQVYHVYRISRMSR